LVAGYLAGEQFIYDVIWWRWQRWRLLVVASLAAFGVYLLVAGLLSGWYTGPIDGRSWIGVAVLLGLAGGALYTVIWWLRQDRLRSEGWRW
jgi:hypothetical protein